MASSRLTAFQILTRVYGGMFGSWLMSSSVDMAFAALTPRLRSPTCNISTALFAARRILRGVVLSLETSLRTPSACLIRPSYSSLRLTLVDTAEHPHDRRPFNQLIQRRYLNSFSHHTLLRNYRDILRQSQRGEDWNSHITSPVD